MSDGVEKMNKRAVPPRGRKLAAIQGILKMALHMTKDWGVSERAPSVSEWARDPRWH